MSKRPAFGQHFEKLRSLRFTAPLDAQKEPEKLPAVTEPPIAQEEPSLTVKEESGSKLNTVQDARSEECTRSDLNPVQNSPGPKRTGAKSHPLTEGERNSPFTAVPHPLLRIGGHFEEPIDFMVYLHLFTYSYGFGRQTASMSHGQLEKFTGASRNTLRRSIERLTEAKWIKCVEEFEHARMSRKWRIYAPEERGSPKGKPTGSKPDPVTNEPRADFTPSGSEIHPVTGSKTDPFIERTPKEKSKNSLSPENLVLREYLESVTPIRKRENEKQAYQGLRQDFSDGQITLCLEYLKCNGLPGSGEACHSPMGFLSLAMGQVLALSQADHEKRLQSESRIRFAKQEAIKQSHEEAEATQEVQAQEKAFMESYSTPEAQADAVTHYSQEFSVLGNNSRIARALAISAWWRERQEEGS